jgi:trehalose-6-phosphatase
MNQFLGPIIYVKYFFNIYIYKEMSNTRKKRVSLAQTWAHKRPWKVTYRNKNGKKTINVLKNGTKKNKLLKQIEKDNLHIYGINNLTDNQIKFYKRKDLL